MALKLLPENTRSSLISRINYHNNRFVSFDRKDKGTFFSCPPKKNPKPHEVFASGTLGRHVAHTYSSSLAKKLNSLSNVQHIEKSYLIYCSTTKREKL